LGGEWNTFLLVVTRKEMVKQILREVVVDNSVVVRKFVLLNISS